MRGDAIPEDGPILFLGGGLLTGAMGAADGLGARALAGGGGTVGGEAGLSGAGLTSGQMGDIIGWGTGQSAEAVAQTEAATASLTSESVQNMISQGLTRDWVEEQLGKYLEYASRDTQAANTQLWPRIDLMNRILDLWPK